MVYSSFGIIALIIHIIINYDILINSKDKDELPADKTYRHFLLGVMCYYISDILWGILYEYRLTVIVYADTVIYFITVTLSLFLLTRYVTEYLNEKNLFGRILLFAGHMCVVFEAIFLLINIFYPILFYFDEKGNYHAGKARYISLLVQIVMLLMISAYTLFVNLKTEGRIRRRYKTIGFYGFVMTILVVIQTIYPLLPFYSIGHLIGTCLLHTFVLEDEKEERRMELENLVRREQLQKRELGTVKHMAYTDLLTGVKNINAYSETEASINMRIAKGSMEDFAVVVFDLNGLKNINDTLGHEAGNRYIKAAAGLICQKFRNSPVYRIGGDEFVTILEGVDYDNRKALLLSFNRQIEKNLKIHSVVVAAGLKEFSRNIDRSFNEVFKQADTRMYERKRQLNDMERQK